MRKQFDFNIFGHDRPILKFIILIPSILSAALLGRFLFCLIEGDKMDWNEYILFSVILIVLSSISYFLGRLLAYKTKMFPKAKREKVLIVTFFGLFLILGVIIVII